MRARLLFSFLVLVALAFPALADRRGGGSLDRVLPEIRRTVPGTFYDADGPFFTPDGRAMYRIKWMTPDGRIIWFTVDAQTGQIVGGMPVGRRLRDDYDDGRRYGDRDNGWRDRDNGRDGWRDRDNGRGGWGDRGHDRGGWGDRGGDRGGDSGGDRGSRGNGRGGDRGGNNHGGNRRPGG